MNEKPLTIKESNLFYILGISSCILLIIASIIVGALILNSNGATPEDELFSTIYAYVFTSLACTALIGVTIGIILTWKKRKFLFYDKKLIIMFGKKATSCFDYTDIDYYLDTWLIGIVIKGKATNPSKQNSKVKSKSISIYLNQNSRYELIEFLDSKGIPNSLEN